jgi:hypothetical protein
VGPVIDLASSHKTAEMMTGPTELQKSLVDEARFLRGRIVAAYSQVEFLLADISVKLDLNFPYLVKDRIKAVKRIAERDGYEIYKEDLDRMCDELLRYDDLRHFMAHGFMSLATDKKGNHQFEFRLYRREGNGKYTLEIRQTTVEGPRQAVGDITEYVSNAVRLFEKIYREQKLEPWE